MRGKGRNVRYLLLGFLALPLAIGCNDNISHYTSMTGAEYCLNQKVEDYDGQSLTARSCHIEDTSYVVSCEVKLREYDLTWVKCGSDLGDKERGSLQKMELDLEKTSSINDIESYEKLDFEGSFEFVFSPNHEPSVGERLYIDFAIRNPKDDMGYFLLEVEG